MSETEDGAQRLPKLRPGWEYAVYSHQPNRHFRGNPFIEALPRVLEEAEVVAQLRGKLVITDEDRAMSRAERMVALLGLDQFFAPLSIHIDLFQRLSAVLRRGLQGRNPTTPEWHSLPLQIAESVRSRMQNPGDLSTSSSVLAGLGMGITGESGVGKSITLQRCLAGFPRVIVHSQYKNRQFIWMQIVAIRLVCPPDGSLAALCRSFFEEVDKVLGRHSDYAKSYGRRGATIDEMLPKVAFVAHAHGLGLLIVDEIQNLSVAKSGGLPKMLNFFTILMDAIGVPVVCVGTDQAVAILDTTLSVARRNSGFGHFPFPPMALDAEFAKFCKGLWGRTLLRDRSPLTSEIVVRLHWLTQGVTDLVVRLFILGQYRALQFGQECLTIELFDQVAAHSFQLLEFFLNSMREGFAYDQDAFHKALKSLDIKSEMARTAAVGTGSSGMSIAEVLEPDQTDEQSAPPQDAADKVLRDDGGSDTLPSPAAGRPREVKARKQGVRVPAPTAQRKPPAPNTPASCELVRLVQEGRAHGKTAYESLSGRLKFLDLAERARAN